MFNDQLPGLMPVPRDRDAGRLRAGELVSDADPERRGLRGCHSMLPALIFFGLLAVPAAAQTPGPSISGDVQMGLVWQPEPDWAGQRESGLRMTSRARLKFRFTGETDRGLRYGVELRLNEPRTRFPDRKHPQAAGPSTHVAQ